MVRRKSGSHLKKDTVIWTEASLRVLMYKGSQRRQLKSAAHLRAHGASPCSLRDLRMEDIFRTAFDDILVIIRVFDRDILLLSSTPTLRRAARSTTSASFSLLLLRRALTSVLTGKRGTLALPTRPRTQLKLLDQAYVPRLSGWNGQLLDEC